MRRIPLKRLTAVDPSGNQTPLSYVNTLIGIAKAPGGGAGYDEMELALAVEDALNAAQEHNASAVLLEEPQYAYLVHCIKTARFGWVSRALQQMCRDVLEAETYDPNASQDPGRMVPRVVGPVGGGNAA